jgi:NADH-quinone oxidoreductase subunit N
MNPVLAALPGLVTPPGRDAIGLLPEIVLGGAFVLLMLVDLVVPQARRGWLAVLTIVAILGSGAAVVYGWYDAATARSVYDGAFAYDRFGLFIDAILLVSALLAVWISPAYLNRREMHHGEFYSLVLAATTGMMLLGSAASLMVIFLALELLSIALYILSGFARGEERSQEAAVKYLLLGAFASGFLLFGMALVYGETGHTQLEQIALAVQAASAPDPLLFGGIILMFVGFAFKVSAAPFHTWTPDVYQGAPLPVTAFMSVATKVAAFAVLIRVFNFTLPTLYSHWNGVVITVAILSMVIGNVAALTQNSVKRMLAYSGIAQAGYILIGVALPGPDPAGSIGALYYLAAYALTNLGAFAVITIMSGRGEDLDSYDSLRGLAFRRPYVAVAMAWFLLSLGGFPPTAGFFGKFLVFFAAIKEGALPLAVWGIATSAISVFYYLRVALLMYSREPDDERRYLWSRTSLSGGLVLTVSGVGTLALGVAVFAVYTLAQTATAAHGVLPG